MSDFICGVGPNGITPAALAELEQFRKRLMLTDRLRPTERAVLAAAELVEGSVEYLPALIEAVRAYKAAAPEGAK